MMDLRERCVRDLCPERAVFGPIGTKDMVYCKRHTVPDFIDNGSPMCLFLDCRETPTHCSPCMPKLMYCEKHKITTHNSCKRKSDFVVWKVKKKRKEVHMKEKKMMCLRDGCGNVAMWGEDVRERCGAHMKPTDKKMTYGSCVHDLCLVTPSFGPLGTRDTIYCKVHAPDGYILVKGVACQYDGCDKVSTHGPSGGVSTMYCEKHAVDGYVQLSSCMVYSCPDEPTHISYTSRSRYCERHAPDSCHMFSRYICLFPMCMRRPIYSHVSTPTRPYAKYCAEHADGNYVKVISCNCKMPKCYKMVRYPHNNDPVPYCDEHRTK